MQLIKTKQLTKQQQNEIEALTGACREFRPLRLSFPYEDGSIFYLAYEPASVLVCALALILPDSNAPEEPAECLAFTHPSYRNRGCFTALFEEAGEELADIDVLIPWDGQDEAVPPVLEALGAEYDSCEYRMELKLSAPASSDVPVPPADQASPAAQASPATQVSPATQAPPAAQASPAGARLMCRVCEEEDGSLLHAFFPAGEATRFAGASADSGTGSSPIAVCHTLSFGTHVCIYRFLVQEELRGQGLGEEALLAVIGHLRRQGANVLYLHVTGENTVAVSLYKKTGFRITETLSYYLY